MLLEWPIDSCRCAYTYRWLHWLHANIHVQSYIFEFTLFKKNRLLKRSSIIYLCMCLSLFVVFLSTVSKEFYSICTIYSIYPSVYLSIHPSIHLSIYLSLNLCHIYTLMWTCKHVVTNILIGNWSWDTSQVFLRQSLWTISGKLSKSNPHACH